MMLIGCGTGVAVGSGVRVNVGAGVRVRVGVSVAGTGVFVEMGTASDAQPVIINENERNTSKTFFTISP